MREAVVQAEEVVARLRVLGRPAALPHMARYGIDTSNAFGVAVPALRRLAREIGRDHALAGELWASGIHDARLLAGMIADPARLNAADAEAWALDFRSWDLCDQCCLNLFRHLPFAHELAARWQAHEREFVRRAAFSLIAVLAVHDKAAGDDRFAAYLPLIEVASGDPSPMVRKSVNWALRQIGKRNAALNAAAIRAAERIAKRGGTARWVASDALRELRSPSVQARLRSAAARSRASARRPRRSGSAPR
ncbi:MAG: DNA alkylation repair protein [Alphaproteobacteria bacterium]